MAISQTNKNWLYFQVAFATLLSAYLLLGEAIAPPAFAGGALILAGVYFVGVDGKRGARAPAKPGKEAQRYV